MTGWTTGFCESNGIRIHYTRTGGTTPPIVLLHGLSANGACWSPLARALEGECDVVMPDARGHGKSDKPEQGYRYSDLANDVEGLIKAMQIPSPVLLGHSMGGLTAALLASRRPELLRGLILADPTFIGPAFQREVFESGVADRHREMLGKPLETLVSDATRKHPGRSAEIVGLLARARLQTSIRVFDILTPPNPEYMELVRAIRTPSLLVISDGGVVSAETAGEIRRVNPKFRLEQIAGAGHGLQYDQPGRFAGVVTSFLRSLPPVVTSG